jgi:hypothetical protein
MELASGTETYKVLDQRQLAAAPATIYTAPGSTQSFIKSIMVVNNDTVSRTIQYFRGGTAAANAITPVYTLLPSGCAVYTDGLGWKFYNKSGQMLVGMTDEPLGSCSNYSLASHLAESIPRNICTETNSVVPTASGTMFMQAIYLPAGITATNVSWHSATTAAGTPTNNIIGLYSGARAKLAETANQTTAAWAANTLKTIPFATPYAVTTSGIYYIGFMMTATTIITSKGNTAITNGALAAQAPILHGASDAGLTTSIPANAAAITGGLVTAWCAIS